MKTPDGKLFYFHAGTNATSWVKPKNALPPGWKTNKTPDGVPFYVHEALQLSTWDRPGEEAKPKPANTPATNVATTAGPTAARATTATGAVVKDGRKGSSTASKIANATYVASNVAKLSAASDLTPSGIITATVAAAKLTSFGVKVAGKKMGKLGKKNMSATSRNLATASNLIGAATRIAGDIEGVEEIEEAIEIQEMEQTALDVADYTGDGVGPANGILEQSLLNPSLGGTPVQMPLSPDFSLQQPPVVFSDTNITIQETFDELNVQCVDNTETNLYVESTDTTVVNQYVQQDTVITDVSWSDTLSIENTPGQYNIG